MELKVQFSEAATIPAASVVQIIMCGAKKRGTRRCRETGIVMINKALQISLGGHTIVCNLFNVSYKRIVVQTMKRRGTAQREK